MQHLTLSKGIITVMDLLGEAAEGEGLASPAKKKPELVPNPRMG